MKLKSKITGELEEVEIIKIDIKHERVIGIVTHEDGIQCKFSYPMYRFKAEWEDAPEEPKEYWYINWNGEVCFSDIQDDRTEQMKLIGNYFETKEKAEKAVEKFKAWKRLKDKGFRFKGYTNDSGDLFSCQVVRCNFNDFGRESSEDLRLLFSGDEE